MLTIIYMAATVGTGRLFVMAIPASGEGIDGLSQLGIDHMVSWARGALVPDTKEQKKWIESLECKNA